MWLATQVGNRRIFKLMNEFKNKIFQIEWFDCRILKNELFLFNYVILNFFELFPNTSNSQQFLGIIQILKMNHN